MEGCVLYMDPRRVLGRPRVLFKYMYYVSELYYPNLHERVWIDNSTCFQRLAYLIIRKIYFFRLGRKCNMFYFVSPFKYKLN